MKTNKDGKMLKRFLSYYKPYKKIFVLDMLASFTMSVIAIFYPIITREMLNELIPNKKYTEIVIYGVGLLLIYLMRMGLSYFVQYQGHMMGVKMQKQMRSDLFAHIEKLPFSFFDNNETGKIMTRMTSDLFDVVELAHHGPENVLITSVSIIISFVYLMSINIPLSLILLVCVPILMIISSYLRKKMRDAFKKRRESNAVINASLESGISGIRVTKAFTNSEKEIENLLNLKKEQGDKIPLSGAMFLQTGPETTYLFGGSYQQYMNYPSQYLVQYTAICDAINNNCTLYNFYGIDGNIKEKGEMHGVYEFKRGFDGEVREYIGEFDLIINKPLYTLYTLAYGMYHGSKRIISKLKK